MNTNEWATAAVRALISRCFANVREEWLRMAREVGRG